ncbi:MAG: nucleotidyltransferase domain-containing protein [Candidatus Sericytochromatia bacterium]|nr:nucleotidyltransferase domain-containing protein [Candidatus Tanganyikabacteria bacterium]
MRQLRVDARQAAEAAAERLATTLGARRIFLFGSLARGIRFDEHSDVDLAVEGIPPQRRFEATLLAEESGGRFAFDVVPIENAPDSLRERIEREGIRLWPR